MKKPASTWRVPPVISRSDVRPHLAAIVRHAAAGNGVLVGPSDKLAFSAFVSEAEFERRQASYRAKSRDIDIEALRQHWSREREQVENTGGPLIILRKGEPVAALVPTTRALQKKVPRTLATLEMSHINLLHQLDQRVIALEGHVSALMNGTLNSESLKELRQTMAVARVVLKEWRDKQGYDGEPPAGPPAP